MRRIILETVSVPNKAFITRDGNRTAVQHAMGVTEEEFATLEVLEGEVLYSVNQETLHIITSAGVTTDVTPAAAEPVPAEPEAPVAAAEPAAPAAEPAAPAAEPEAPAA
jgi:preprotein translocase subunit SecD